MNLSDRIARAYARPPLSWFLSAFYWMADHFVRPWMEPLLRPYERWDARRRIARLRWARAIVASCPDLVAKADEAIAMWTGRLAELDRGK